MIWPGTVSYTQCLICTDNVRSPGNDIPVVCVSAGHTGVRLKKNGAEPPNPREVYYGDG